jgi:hypothetical protein
VETVAVSDALNYSVIPYPHFSGLARWRRMRIISLDSFMMFNDIFRSVIEFVERNYFRFLEIPSVPFERAIFRFIRAALGLELSEATDHKERSRLGPIEDFSRGGSVFVGYVKAVAELPHSSVHGHL